MRGGISQRRSQRGGNYQHAHGGCDHCSEGGLVFPRKQIMISVQIRLRSHPSDPWSWYHLSFNASLSLSCAVLNIWIKKTKKNTPDTKILHTVTSTQVGTWMCDGAWQHGKLIGGIGFSAACTTLERRLRITIPWDVRWTHLTPLQTTQPHPHFFFSNFVFLAVGGGSLQ